MSRVKTCLGPALMRAPRAHLRRGDRPWPTGSRGAPPPSASWISSPRARASSRRPSASTRRCAFGRQALTNVTLGGHEIPAGTVVLVSTYGLHHNPSVYPDPERFDPDRFAPEAEAARHRSAWLPFGNGQRVCIGNHFALLEGQIVLAALAHRVAFEPKPGADVKPAPAATLRPSGGMPMIVRRRDLARTGALSKRARRVKARRVSGPWGHGPAVTAR